MKLKLLTRTLLLLSILLSGCGGKELDEEIQERELYKKARIAMKAERFQTAIIHFESLESKYPFGDYALQAHLDLAYSYYQFNKLDKAAVQADRFIRLYPTHKNIDYAYYLKGVVEFDQNKSVKSFLSDRDPSNYDQQPLINAFNNFLQLLGKFPDSQYAPDVRKRMVFLRNKMAEHELVIAEYYMKRKAYAAVITRGNYVLENFSETATVKKILVLMAEAYQKLGLPDAANNVALVLNFNHSKTNKD